MGRKKCGTHARVHFRTLEHWNNKIEIKETNQEGKQQRVKIEITVGTEKMKSRDLTAARALLPDAV